MSTDFNAAPGASAHATTHEAGGSDALSNQSITTAKIADAAVTQAQVKTKAAVALADAAATLTAAQMVDSGIFTITPTVARTLTTDTAANIIAGISRQQVGTWFDFTIINTAAFDVTLAAGTGVTLSGATVIHSESSSWRCRIDSATAVTIYNLGLTTTATGTGSIVRATSPTLTTPAISQIAFPATQVASTGANTLDDYEQGSWTPTLQDDTFSNAESQTYTTQAGRYTKIGDFVHIGFRLTMLSLGTLTTTQDSNVAGLPFIPLAGLSFDYGFGLSVANNLAITAGQAVTINFENGAARMNAQLWDSAVGTTALLISEISADGLLQGGGSYKTSD